MCGITGILAFTELGKKHLHKINAAANSLIRRGPDGEGIFIKNNVALGHRRLSNSQFETLGLLLRVTPRLLNSHY